MKTIGFPITDKENENRRAVLPMDLEQVSNTGFLYFEKGYGSVLGYTDADYEKYGAHITTHQEVLKQNIICDAKIGDAQYLSELPRSTTLFGWIHAVQNRNITDKIIDKSMTAYAWEDMYEEGRHCFWRNNEIAGEAAVLHAFQCYGMMPYDVKVALIGKGNTARGALKILTLLGADVTVYDRKTERLFQKELYKYDVIVNSILWDTNRTDHIIYEKDLSKMRKGALIIDVSCDAHGGIESSVPTSIENPIYKKEGVWHYVVDHTPSLFYKTASAGISKEVCRYLDMLCTESSNDILKKAKIIEDGIILDNRINTFQRR